jgi:phosphomannomutase
MMEQLVSGTLTGMGVNVINISLATTPTTEIAVTTLGADGGIILTASHNPKQWNALKLLNSKGEFLSADDGSRIIELVEKAEFSYAYVDELGKMSTNHDMNDYHIQQVLDLPLVDAEKIRDANFKVAIDCVNSVGGVIIPDLLKQLGVSDIVELYCEPNGDFPHNPEPLPANLTDISEAVRKNKADLGFVVDPDVDRLAIVCEDGSMFGEEYTLVAVADYVLGKTPGSTCSNLSSSRALRMISEQHGQKYFTSAVGEVNVVEMMKKEKCVIGGEGNGGIIYPELHYGRDALVGIALFLTYLAERTISCTELRKSYPQMEMIKNKISLTPETDIDAILKRLESVYQNESIDKRDGLKIDFAEGWIHLRKSNTEPIIRVYAEAKSKQEAEKLVSTLMKEI